MNNIVIKIESKLIKAKDLKIHPLLKRLGLDKNDMGTLLEIFTTQAACIGHYDRICVDTSMKVISNPEVLLAAQINDKEQFLEVDVLDIHENDLIQFINAKNLFRQRSFYSKWKYLRELRNHLETNERGKAWKERLLYGDINETIAKLTYYRQTHIKRLAAVGRYADTHPTEKIWERLKDENSDDGDDKNKMSFIELYNYIQNKAKPPQPIKASKLDVVPDEESDAVNDIIEGKQSEQGNANSSEGGLPPVGDNNDNAISEADKIKEAELAEARGSLNAADYFQQYVRTVDEEKTITLFKAIKKFLPVELQTDFVSEFKNITGTIRTIFHLDEETIEIERVGFRDKIVDHVPFCFRHSSKPENPEA